MTRPHRFRVPELDLAAHALAEARQAQLTKPAGSLGRLEQLAIQAAGWQGLALPEARPAAALLFAADHPVTAHGVSAYPSTVTRAMLDNFARGGAAASVLARALGIELHVVDVGVDGAGDGRAQTPLVTRDPVAERGAGDIRAEDALDATTYAEALAAGARAVDRLPAGTRVLLPGELGIGNTTVAAAVFAALFGGDPDAFVGRGTGVGDDALARKRQVVCDAVRRLGGEREPHEVMRRVGGRELAALLGAIGCGLERRLLVVVDGFVVTAAAAALLALQPEARGGLVFAHRSGEGAHARVLELLRVQPLLDLGLRLGEGSGALAAYPLLELACRLHAEMATFAAAAVPERLDD